MLYFIIIIIIITFIPIEGKSKIYKHSLIIFLNSPRIYFVMTKKKPFSGVINCMLFTWDESAAHAQGV